MKIPQAVPSRKNAARDDDDDEDDRPKRRKNRKKSAGNTMLYLMLGGGVLAVGLIVVVVVIIGRRGAEEKDKPAPQAKSKKEPVPEPEPEPKPKPKGKGGLIRQRDLLEYRPYFKQIGLAYFNIASERGKGPDNVEEFRAHLRSPEIMKLFDTKQIEFCYGAKPQQMQSGASSTIVGYEPVADRNGLRLVIMGDGSVQELNEGQFDKTAKATR